MFKDGIGGSALGPTARMRHGVRHSSQQRVAYVSISWIQEECEAPLFRTRTHRLVYPYDHYPYRPYRPYRPYETTFSLPVQTVHTVRSNFFHYPYRPYGGTFQLPVQTVHDPTQLYGVHVRSVRRTCAVSTAYVRSVLSVRSVRVVPVRSTEWSCMGIWGSKATLLLNPAKP